MFWQNIYLCMCMVWLFSPSVHKYSWSMVAGIGTLPYKLLSASQPFEFSDVKFTFIVIVHHVLCLTKWLDICGIFIFRTTEQWVMKWKYKLANGKQHRLINTVIGKEVMKQWAISLYRYSTVYIDGSQWCILKKKIAKTEVPQVRSLVPP